MPCIDNYDGDRSWDRGYYENQLRSRLNTVTELLCALCQRLEKDTAYTYIGQDPRLAGWWDLHKEADKHRRQEELADKQRNLDELQRKQAELQQEIEDIKFKLKGGWS